MNDNIEPNVEPKDKKTGMEAAQTHGSSLLAWISVATAIVAWVALIWLNGYLALGAAVVSAACGFAGIPNRTANIRRLATTSIIAAIVLIVVVSAYLVVLKIGLA